MIKILKLRDVCTDIIDCPHESPVWLTEGYARVIRNFNLIDGQISDAEPYYVDENTYNKRTHRAIPEPGDIIFSREAPIGNCAIVPEGFKCCLGQRLVLLKVDHSKVSSNYLLTVLMSNYVKYQIEQVSKRGSIVSNFNIGDLSNLKIPVLTNQSDIAQFANDISSKITNNRCINNKLESLAKTIYDYWFLQFEFPNEEGKPYKSSGGKMVWNDELKREIPEGWEVKPLVESIANDKYALVDGPFGTQMKIGEYVDSGIPIYEMEMLNNNYVLDSTIKHYITDAKFDEVKRSAVKNGDIIISKTGTLGLLGIVESEYDKGIIVSRLAKITPDENIIGKYPLFLYLKGLNDSGYWLQHCGGSTMPILNNTIIGNVPILIPNTDLYAAYSKKVDGMFKQIHINQMQNQELASLRDFLLPMLMNGQVTFKDKEDAN